MEMLSSFKTATGKTFSVKDHIVNVLDFVSHISIRTYDSTMAL